MTVTVRKLLSRGDEVCIECGRLVIHPASGNPVPPDWFQEHSSSLIREILTKVGIDAFEYRSYTTGNYGKPIKPGVTLHFKFAVSDALPYAIFNATLTRSRSSQTAKKGSPLPKGHFRVGRCSHLYRFWQSTGLPEPKRLAALHDYMGNLRGILFSAAMVAGHENRINAGSVRPLSVPSCQVRKAFIPDSTRTTPGQAPDKLQTRMPDKELAQGHKARDFWSNPATRHEDHGNAAIRICVDTGAGSRPHQRKRPEEQTVDEWLADYDSPSD